MLTSRARYIADVTQAFDGAGVRYVLLGERLRVTDTDSDLDVGVDVGSLPIADAIVRLGMVGRLVQRFDYDVPWCRFYVMLAEDNTRRYRELDIACDPYGASRYGLTIQYALDHAVQQTGVPVPIPAADLAYLCAKRATKGVRRPRELEALRRLYFADPLSAEGALQEIFGSCGEHLARGLGSSDLELARALEEVARGIRRQQRQPAVFTKRSVQRVGRIVRRLARPTGYCVTLVGPDGVGKTTLSQALEDTCVPFRQVRRLHLRPGVLPVGQRCFEGRRLRVWIRTRLDHLARPAPSSACFICGSIHGWGGRPKYRPRFADPL